MKEFHIISSGVSVLTNAQRANLIPHDKKLSDSDYWETLLQNPAKINELKEFVKSDPRKNSAELNTFLRVVENKDPKEIEVYLFGTNTSSNELCRRVIESYLKENGFMLYTPIEVSGYFWEAKFDEKYAIDEFRRGISDLLDRLIYLGKKKKEEGYKVYFNPTGGLKAHVIVTALAAFLVDAEVYYMNEEFNEVVFLPPLFYIPKGKEVEILQKLNTVKLLSGKDAEKLYSEASDEIERLLTYGLIAIEEDESNKIYRIKLTEKGKFLNERFRSLK
ncbi:MAG: putative CRISPR-associated protein [Thermoplasmata archaeon]